MGPARRARLVGGSPVQLPGAQTSKAVGLRDGKLWQTVVANRPRITDSDGLASYFTRAAMPTRAATPHGHLLAATHEAAAINPALRCQTRPVRRWSAP